jgi:hypothetical protein
MNKILTTIATLIIFSTASQGTLMATEEYVAMIQELTRSHGTQNPPQTRVQLLQLAPFFGDRAVAGLPSEYVENLRRAVPDPEAVSPSELNRTLSAIVKYIRDKQANWQLVLRHMNEIAVDVLPPDQIKGVLDWFTIQARLAARQIGNADLTTGHALYDSIRRDLSTLVAISPGTIELLKIHTEHTGALPTLFQLCAIGAGLALDHSQMANIMMQVSEILICHLSGSPSFHDPNPRPIRTEEQWVPAPLYPVIS